MNTKSRTKLILFRVVQLFNAKFTNPKKPETSLMSHLINKFGCFITTNLCLWFITNNRLLSGCF